MCKDGSYGSVFFENPSICVNGNGKAKCKPNTNWTINEAASFICN